MFPLLPITLALGIGLYFALPFEPPWLWLGWGALGILLMAGLVARRFWRVSVGLLLLAVALGGVWRAGWQVERVRAPVIPEKLEAAWVTGRIVQVEPKEKNFRLLLEDVGMDGFASEQTPKYVRITIRSVPEGVEAGEVVRLRATLFPPSAPAMPGAFDFARYAYFKQLGAVGYGLSLPTIIGGDQEPASDWGLKIQQLRDRITARFQAALPPDQSAIAVSLVVGEQGAITPEVRLTLQQAGLSHILSISGLHMALVTGFVFLMIRRLLAFWPYAVLHWPLKKIACVVALCAAAAYMLLSGAPVPAQRSFIMAALVLLAVWFDRTSHPMRVIAIAALAVLLWTPESLLSASFQLSFAATLGLIAYYQLRRERREQKLGEAHFTPYPWWQRPFVYVGDTAMASLTASLVTAPYSLYHFGSASISGIVANMLVLPITGFVTMPAGVVAMLAIPLGFEALPMQLMGESLAWMMAIAEWVNRDIGWVFRAPPPPLWVVLIATCAGLWLLLMRGWVRLALLPVALACWIAAVHFQPLPVLLMDEEATAIALEDGRWLLWAKKEKNWMSDQWAEQLEVTFCNRETCADAVICDAQGCVVQAKAGRVALPLLPDALPEDCLQADVVIWRGEDAPTACKAHLLVGDAKQLRREGPFVAYAQPWQVRRMGMEDVGRGWRP